MAEKAKKKTESKSAEVKKESVVQEDKNSRVLTILNNLNPQEYTSSTQCWDAVRCGHEGTCEVPKNHHGRQCYLYDHTFCFGEDMGPFHVKIKTCVELCPFYQSLIPEIGAMWVDAHKQIAQQGGQKLTGDLEKAILAERAKQLSLAYTVEEAGEKIDVILFQLGGDNFAVETKFVNEIRPMTEITPVPCTPDFVLGIASVRGLNYSVLDIRNSLNAEERSFTEETMLMILSSRDLDVCIVIDRVLQKRTVLKREIKTAAAGQAVSRSFIDGVIFVNDQMVSIINWEKYLAENNITVNEEI